MMTRPPQSIGHVRAVIMALVSWSLVASCDLLRGPDAFVFAACVTNADCPANRRCSSRGTCHCANQQFLGSRMLNFARARTLKGSSPWT